MSATRRLLWMLLGCTACALWWYPWSAPKANADLVLEAGRGSIETPIGELSRAPDSGPPADHRLEPVLLPEPEHAAVSDDTVSIIVSKHRGGNLIQGASIAAERAGIESVLGRTDLHGTLSLDEELIEGKRLVIGADGFASRSWSVGSDTPEQIRVSLRRGSTIRGRLTFADGTNPGAGVRVLAWPSSGTFGGRAGGTNALRKASLGSFAHTLVSSAHDGRFVIRGLDPAQSYALAAGGAGCISAKVKHKVRPGAGVVDIPVQALFGAIVRFAEPSGGLRLNDQLLHSLDSERLGLDAGPRLLGIGKLGAQLALRDTAVETNDRVFLFVQDGNAADVVGPIRLTYDKTGYAPGEIEFWAQRLNGPAQVLKADLVPTANGYGQIVLKSTADQAQPFLAPNNLVEEAATLSLISRDGGRNIRIGLPNIVRSGWDRVDGIPFGAYDASVRFSHGSFVFPRNGRSLQVQVAAQPAEIVLESQELGSIEVVIRYENGLGYDGPLVAMLGTGAPTNPEPGDQQEIMRIRSAPFSEPPYVYAGLRPGKYDVIVVFPSQAQQGVTVSANEGSTVLVLLGEAG